MPACVLSTFSFTKQHRALRISQSELVAQVGRALLPECAELPGFKPHSETIKTVYHHFLSVFSLLLSNSSPLRPLAHGDVRDTVKTLATYKILLRASQNSSSHLQNIHVKEKRLSRPTACQS